MSTEKMLYVNLYRKHFYLDFMFHLGFFSINLNFK